MNEVNLSAPTKKGLVSRSTKPKFAKRGDDSFETCSDIIPYKGGLPPIANTVLEGSSPPSACTPSNRHSTENKPKPSAPKPFMDAPPSRTCDSKRKTSPPALYAITEGKVCYL